MLNTFNGVFLIKGSDVLTNKNLENNKMAKEVVKVKMVRSAYSKGEVMEKGKVLEFDKKNMEWLNLVHANAAVVVKEEEVKSAKK